MPNELVRQQNVQSVLRSAMKLFVANGVENTSMEMIARESNLTLRSVQNYFHTKNDLIAAALERGYAVEFEEMSAFFASETYQSKNGAEQVLEIITVALNKAVEFCDIVFCTAQLQHIVSRASDGGESPRLTENQLFLMEQLQGAFEKGMTDGSIAQTIGQELVDVKTVMLALRGTQEQIAFAMRDKTLRELLDPEAAVGKFIRQMELILIGKRDG